MKHFAGAVVLLGVTTLFGGIAYATTPPSAATATLASNSWPQSVKAILARSKAAMGGSAWDQVHSLRVRATIEVGGLSGPITSLQDLSTGRSVGHAKLGPIKLAEGFDGKTAWKMGSNGEVTLQKPPTPSGVTTIYQKRYAWWYPRRWPAKIKLVGTTQSEGKTFEVLHITPQGGTAFDMWVNAKTHFIARFVGGNSSGTGTLTTLLEDYRAVHEVKIAFYKQTTNDVTQRRQITKIESVDINVPVNARYFAIPSQQHDISIIDSLDSVTIPFTSKLGYINVPVEINKHSLRFIVDSGGHNVMSSRSARSLGIVGEGAIAAAGVGSSHVKQSYAKVKMLTLNRKVTFKSQTFAVQPMQDADGALGSAMFHEFVVRVDYANRKLSLIQPNHFDSAKAGTPLPLKVVGDHMLVQAKVGGIKGWFVVDTGASNTIILNTPFCKEHNLYKRFNASPLSPSGHGYNGAIVARKAQNIKVSFGPFHGELPEISLSTATTGFTALKHIAGTIGNGILKHFTVSIDYAGNTVYFKPNKT